MAYAELQNTYNIEIYRRKSSKHLPDIFPVQIVHYYKRINRKWAKRKKNFVAVTTEKLSLLLKGVLHLHSVQNKFHVLT